MKDAKGNKWLIPPPQFLRVRPGRVKQGRSCVKAALGRQEGLRSHRVKQRPHDAGDARAMRHLPRKAWRVEPAQKKDVRVNRQQSRRSDYT